MSLLGRAHITHICKKIDLLTVVAVFFFFSVAAAVNESFRPREFMNGAVGFLTARRRPPSMNSIARDAGRDLASHSSAW